MQLLQTFERSYTIKNVMAALRCVHAMGNKMAAPSSHQWSEHLISTGFALPTLWVDGQPLTLEI
jgi:hypothetical protein